MVEIWKDIKDYEGLYQVSNLGNVRSVKNGKKNILKFKIDKSKKTYYRVSLSKKNIVKTYSAHRLVALAFIPNDNEFPIINHKDENKLNNNVNNLEWCDYSYNNSYGKMEGHWKGSKNPSINKRKEVYEYDLQGKLLNIYKSTVEAGKINKVCPSSIGACCNGRYKTIKNKIYRYKGE